MSGITINWISPGPVVDGFMASNAFVRAISGPVGSGKTSGCIIDPIRKNQELQHPDDQGVKRWRHAIIRDTYRNLEKTTLRSAKEWFPPGPCVTWTGGRSDPPLCKISYKSGLYRHEIELVFVAIGDNTVEEVLRGLELTSAYINEADGTAKEALQFLLGRVGRYPPKNKGGTAWSGIILDFNAPEIDNWIYDVFYDQELPEGWEFYRQPGARESGAENLHNLPENYYQNQLAGADDWYIRRMIDNLPGFSRAGQPIFPMFNDILHVAPEPIRPVKGIPLRFGADAGRTPALIISQELPGGCWNDIDEIIGDDEDAKTFGKRCRRYLAENYPDFKFGVCGCDPASVYKHDTDEFAWIDIFQNHSGLKCKAAPTNSWAPRVGVIKQLLNRMVGGRPAYRVSPRCRVLRRGFNSEYRYPRNKSTGNIGDRPEKNGASHPHDANQYQKLTSGEYQELRGKTKRRSGGGAKVETQDKVLNW